MDEGDEQMVRELDEKDLRILELLRFEGRASTVRIAAKTGIPRVTVHDRMDKLRREKVIRKFAALPNYSALGLGTTAFVLVAYDHSKTTQLALARRLALIANVSEVFVIAGEWDLLLKVRGKSIEDIGDVVVEKLRKLEGVGRTLTIACFKAVKEDV